MEIKALINSKKVSLTYLFFWVVVTGIQAQDPSPADSLIYESILNAEFTNASSALHDRTTNSAYYLTTLVSFLKTATTGDKEAYESFQDQADNALKKLAHAKEDDLWAHYYHQEILLQESFLLLLFDHEISAAWHLRQTYKEAKKNLFAHDDFFPFHKTFGVLETVVGAVPENMQWIPGLFGMSGTTSSGLDHLNLVVKNVPRLKTEAALLSSLVNSYLLEDHQKAIDEYVSIWKDRTGSPLITYLGMNLMLRAHKASEAIEMYDKIALARRGVMPLLEYMAGTAYLQIGKYPEAEQKFLLFLTNYSGRDFIKDCYYKLFLTQWLRNNTREASLYFDNIKDKGNTLTEADRYAEAQTALDYPEPTIMKLRLFTDGGAFLEAGQLIRSITEDAFKKDKDQVEWIYRKGRFSHLEKNFTTATELYLECIKRQKNESWYFAPNSCLQLGYIYLKNDKPELAEKYFESVFDYKNYPYQKGIERSAQVALNTYF